MVYIIKSTGEKEPFSENKIITSIKRAKIPGNLQDQVLAHVKSKLYNDMPTSEIYSHILEFLKKSPQPYTQTRYRLKEAIMELGPTGYPFEDFLAKVFTKEGYTTKTRSVIDGQCIKHEIDIIAEKNSSLSKEKLMIEAKFHNLPGTKTDVQAALYTKARFDDIKQRNGFTKAWLVTNTNITIDAIAYANCVGMGIMGWDYPTDQSIRDKIEAKKLFPITVLTTLSKEQKQKLAERGVVVCSDITDLALNNFYISDEQKEAILSEVEFLHHT